MTDLPEHVVVVGAGLAGLRTLEELRQTGYTGRLTLVGAEQHLPYDRPPLSKQVLAGSWTPERALLTDDDALAALQVDVRLGQPAVRLRKGSVELEDGSVIGADAIVVATGSHPRRLPQVPADVSYLRTLDDAVALTAAMAESNSILVVGAGFIGAEIASTAHAGGLKVTIVEAAPVPMSRVLGQEVGRLCAALIREAGVELLTGVGVRRFDETATPGVRAELSDGSVIEADLAVAGIGGTPSLDWLGGLGLDLSDGILCQADGRVIGLESVWALGDVASWLDDLGEEHHRHEHWTSATHQAAVVARSIQGQPLPSTTIPYVWSDQFGYKIQVNGRPDRADSVGALHGEGLSGGSIRGTVVGYFCADRLVAVVGFSAARRFVRYRDHVMAGSGRAEVTRFAAELEGPST